MRPVSLTLEGFGVFRTKTHIDFSGTDYFALVGPTGAGKSTVIDAICFALYGSIPRYENERLVARAVSVGSQQAKVSLAFDIGETRYVATRVVRIGKGKADAVLERHGADGIEVLASGAREMKPAVEQLLGLPFAHFTKCVVLPQGDFAKFLHDAPAERRGLLTRLLDLGVYERIGQRARETAKEAGKAVEMHARQLEELSFATPEARTALEQRVEQLREAFRAVDDARADDERAADAIATAEHTGKEAEHVVAALTSIQPPADADELADELAQAGAVRDRMRVETAETAAALATAEDVVSAGGEREPLVRALEAHAQHAQLLDQLSAADAVAAIAQSEAARGDDLVARARSHVEESQRALDAARRANAGHELARHLEAGEPCPVCEQLVSEVPKRRRAGALTKVEKALVTANQLFDESTAAHRTLVHEHAQLAARHAALAEQTAACAEAIADFPDPDALTTTIAQLDAAHEHLAAARQADKDARAREKVAETAVTRAEQFTARVRADYATARDTVLRAGGTPPAAAADIGAAWRELAEWIESERAAQSRVVAETTATRDQLVAARAARLSELSASIAAVGVPIRATNLTTLRDLVVEHGTHARNELQGIDDAIERAVKVRVEMDEAARERAVAHVLGELLRSDRFEKWVLAEALALLVDAASETLLALTQGHFSLQYSSDEEFVVVDHHNADATRSVRTLSGGETFQASLALALALSDQLAELSAAGGAKLEAIFLDEGFGSLDVDTLDAVASTIEALGTTGRMVGIVTHVPALAERVPLCFRIDNGTVTREAS